MGFKKLFWQFYFSFLLITVIVSVALTILSSRLLTNSFINETQKALETEAKFVSQAISQDIIDAKLSRVEQFCKQIGNNSDTRVTVIEPSGKVIGDSQRNPILMGNHSNRPEIISVKRNKIGIETRYSQTLDQPMMYVAIGLYKDKKLISIIRTSKSLTTIDMTLGGLRRAIIKYSLIIVIISAFLSLIITRRINRPLEEIISGLDNFAQGNFDQSLTIPHTKDLAKLSIAMNNMASELDVRIHDILNQKNEMQAILTSMSEGVIALDSSGNILNINAAACVMLSIDDCNNPISTKDEIPNTVLREFIDHSLKDSMSVDTELDILDEPRKNLRVRCNPLINSHNQMIGTIVVLNDITILRQLERVRSEFVANVSHELKTPITSIMGFIETLRDGVIENPDQAQHFMEIIARQARRLNSIIEDILILSKIEDQSNQNKIDTQIGSIKSSIDSAIEVCQIRAAKKNIKIITAENDIEAPINEFLLEQAIVNLLSNAIKYSDENKTVEILLASDSKYATISVIDHGYGIGAEHLERIFERFYVVDKARSRNLGGTGLGLAIVKHIAQAHKGFVSIESELAKGSVFTIHIPLSLE